MSKQIDRRDFIRTLSAAGSAGAIGMGAGFAFRAAVAEGSDVPDVTAHRRRSLRILILGGTGQTGPFQVEYAVARGHLVTVFNRGRSTAELPAGVERLVGDRNDDLEALKGREWDAVIDNPTTLPIWVRDAASLLRDSVDHYLFVSTISVYADFSRPGFDESASLVAYVGEDPMAETLASLQQDMRLYGPLKALSEREAERWFPGRTTIIRPGLIVGPRDETDRFTYWPDRVARGGEVLAPGTPTDPVQIIDGRDLAEWTIRLIEERTIGTFNATGPAERLSFGQMLEAMRPLGSDDLRFTWVPADFLASRHVQPWSDMPSWAPPIGEMAGFAQVDNSRAVSSGLTFRSLSTTARDTLAWFRALPPGRQAEIRAGIGPEREAEVLRAWRSR
jgi:2'-hydroxyisoflavone reductase